MSPKGHEYPHQNHPDKEHVEKRMEDFFKAYKARDAEAMADFFHPEKFAYSAFRLGHKGLKKDDAKQVFTKIFQDYHDDMEITSRSIHGHKGFSVWEWTITCRPKKCIKTGKHLTKDEAPHKRLLGCSLMWWDDDDKIVRNHDYSQMSDIGDPFLDLEIPS